MQVMTLLTTEELKHSGPQNDIFMTFRLHCGQRVRNYSNRLCESRMALFAPGHQGPSEETSI